MQKNQKVLRVEKVKSYNPLYDFNAVNPGLNNYPVAPTGQVLEKQLIHGVLNNKRELVVFSILGLQQYYSQKNSSPKAKPEEGIFPFTRTINEVLNTISQTAYIFDQIKDNGMSYIVQVLKEDLPLYKDFASITLESKQKVSNTWSL